MTDPAEAAGPEARAGPPAVAAQAGAGRAAEKELTVLTHVYDLLLRLIPATGRFPKNQRYLLGERLASLRYQGRQPFGFEPGVGHAA